MGFQQTTMEIMLIKAKRGFTKSQVIKNKTTAAKKNSEKRDKTAINQYFPCPNCGPQQEPAKASANRVFPNTKIPVVIFFNFDMFKNKVKHYTLTNLFQMNML